MILSCFGLTKHKNVIYFKVYTILLLYKSEEHINKAKLLTIRKL